MNPINDRQGSGEEPSDVGEGVGLLAVTRADEALADAIAGALARYSVAYSHSTAPDMSTFDRKWRVHECKGDNPFDRDEWLGEFDNKADAGELAATLRRDAALQVAARHRLASTPPAAEVDAGAMREALEPSGATKAAYHGEFTFDLFEGVSDAGIDQHRKVYVPWDTVKQIMAAIRARAARNQTAAALAPRENKDVG